MSAENDFTSIMQLDGGKAQAEAALLYERFRPMLLDKAERMLTRFPWLQGKCEAADLVQETLLRACRSHHQCRASDDQDRFRWLKGILRHRMADVYRRYSGRKRAIKKELTLADAEQLQEVLKTVPTDDPTPSSQYRRKETAEELQKAVDSLPELERRVLLAKKDGQTYDQIAEELGTNSAAVKRLLQDAINKLRLQLHIPLHEGRKK